MRKFMTLLGLMFALTFTLRAQELPIQCGKVEANKQTAVTGKKKAPDKTQPKFPSSCAITYFDRVEDLMWSADLHKPSKTDRRPDRDLNYVSIIRESGTKVLYSGTILDAKYGDNDMISPLDTVKAFEGICKKLDWRVVAMAKESSNILIYGPADVSEYCPTDSNVVIVLPVTVIWAELYYREGNLGDPFRKTPAPITAATMTDGYCNVIGNVTSQTDKPILGEPTSVTSGNKRIDTTTTSTVTTTTTTITQERDGPKGFETVDDKGNRHNTKHSPIFDPAGDIRPCDRYSWLKFMYNSPSRQIWNSWTQPGASAGSISYTPGLGKIPNLTDAPTGEKAPTQALTYDLQEYPSQQLGYGYIGVPVVFEKSSVATSNLNSLIFGVSYDLPIAESKKTILNTGYGPWRAFMRPPDVRFQYGPEMGVTTPHDLNVTASLTARFPLVVNMPRQPSVLTVFPVIGLEGGNRVRTHAIQGVTNTDPISRKIAGYDISLRSPFVVTHAFLGDKPATVSFSWRTRYLSYNEPFTDFVSGYPERLTKVKRSYWRGTYTLPFGQLASFKVSVQHGGLPPDFAYLGYSVNLGVTLGNPGYSEQ
jgi:hypothetical protein